MLDTLSLPPKIIAPFLVMILVSFVTPRGSKAGLDRYFVKMKTPVLPDHAADVVELEKSYAEPDRFNDKKLFPRSDLEIQRPTKTDILGFVISVIICFAIVWMAVLVANIGA
jgi:SSS family solute:Na+ symporter